VPPTARTGATGTTSAASGTAASEPAPERESIQTLVAVRDAGGWSFASFQNTRIRPIGAGAVSALLWLVPDRLWRLRFRLSKTAPPKAVALGETKQ